MADNLYITSGLTRADAGTQDFTVGGESRTPIAALFFFGLGATNGTPADDAMLSIGMTDGTRQRAFTCWSEDNEANTDAYRISYTNRVAVNRDNVNTFEYVTFNSFVTGGVRVNIADGGGGIQQHLLKVVLVFSDSGSAHANHFAMGFSADSTTTVTDPGFESDLVFAVTPSMGASATASIASLSFGVIHNGGSIVQRCQAYHEPDNDAEGSPAMAVSTSYGAMEINEGTGTITWGADWTAFSSTGFTVTTRLNSGNGDAVFYLALKLPDSNIWLGSVDSPTATGDNDNTTPGFQPNFGLIGVSMAQAYDTLEVDADAGTYFISMFDASASHCIGFHVEDAAGTTNTGSLAAAQAMDVLTDTGADAFVGTFGSFLSTGRRLNFTTADGTTRKWWELLIGSTAVGGLSIPIAAYHYAHHLGSMA